MTKYITFKCADKHADEVREILTKAGFTFEATSEIFDDIFDKWKMGEESFSLLGHPDIRRMFTDAVKRGQMVSFEFVYNVTYPNNEGFPYFRMWIDFVAVDIPDEIHQALHKLTNVRELMDTHAEFAWKVIIPLLIPYNAPNDLVQMFARECVVVPLRSELQAVVFQSSLTLHGYVNNAMMRDDFYYEGEDEME